MANGAEVYVFQKGFRQSASNLRPGDFFQKADGSFWKVLADGSQVPFGGAGGAISVTDGSTTVDPASSLDFTAGATVTDGGGGVAQVAANGGSSPVSMLSVPISSAELLALDTAPKVLLPAAGGRLYHIIHGVVLHYRFGTTPYSGDFLPVFGFGDTAGEIQYFVPALITAVNQGTQTFTIAGDWTASLPPASTFNVAGSSGNDGSYTVDTVAFAAGHTNIATVEAIPDATANGTLSPANAGPGTSASTNANNASQLFGSGESMLQQSEDAYLYAVGVNFSPVAQWNAWLAATIEDKAFSMMNAPATLLADGDGTVTARVFYTTIDGAP